jgi:PPP family 3-phenylpropionic acid transporter
VPSRLLTLRLFYFTSLAALGAYAPFLARWLEARGIQGVAMGAVAALTPAMGVVGPPLVGLLADTLALRGSLLRVCCAGAGLALAALALLASAGGALTFGVVFTAVLVYGAFRSPMTMLADVVALERARDAGTTYGRLRLWGSLGFLIGVVAAGRVIDPSAPAALPAVVAGALFLALLAAWRLPAKREAARLPVLGEARALLIAPDFARFLAFAFLAQGANASYDLCFSLHLRDLGASDTRTGVAWALGVFFEIVLMAGADRLLARHPAPVLLAASLLGAAGRWALLAAVPSLPVLFALQPLHAISFALWWVCSVAYTKERAPAHALAAAQGLFTAAAGAGSVAGMLAWGLVYRRTGGAAAVFGGAAVVALLAGLLAIPWSRRAA